MRTVFKLVSLVVVLVIAGLIAIPFVVDPNDYKQQISDQVEKATGRQLTLQGDIGLSVFPWIALKLGPLSLSNAKSFNADPFARVEAAEVRIKLMPLLQKQLEMDTVILDGLVLNLQKNKAGTTNWDDLAGSDKKTDSKPTDDAAKTDDNAAPALAAITIAGVQLTNANILWSDASTGQTVRLEKFNLNTDPLSPGKPTAVDMDFSLVSTKPQATVHVALDSKVMVDLDKQHYALSELTLKTQAEGKELPFTTADIELSGDINADMIKQLVAINNLVLTAKVNKDQQAIDAKLTTNLTTNLSNQQTQLKLVDLSATVTDPNLPTGKADVKLTADIAADMHKQTLSLSALALEVYDVIINADVSANKILSDTPVFSGKLNVKPFNLRQLANKLAIELPLMADDSTLELVQLDTDFIGSSTSFDAKQLKLTLDQTNLTGQFAVTDFAKSALKFALVIDNIDADRYMPPVTEQTTAAPPAASAAAGASQLPLETLRQINAQGTFDIGKLKISGTHSEKIHLQLNAADGLIKLSPISANLYQGQYQGNVNLDARGNSLKLSINENLKDVQAGPLLKDLKGDDTISGLANAQVKLSGNGATIEQIKQTLTGNGQFSFTNGALKGVNIAESIRKAKAALKGETIAESEAPLKTDFSALSGSFTATNGIIDNQDLLAMSPLLRINGAGKVDLPKEGIDYGLKVSIVGTSKGQDGKSLDELKGLTIPVKITGTFTEPKPTVDLASLLKDKVTQEVKAKVADKLKDKVGGDLGGLLGGALGTTSEPETKQTPADITTEPAPEQTEQPAPSVEDQAKDALKNKLKSLF
ncbi:MAG: AsmA family protein [Gammaproteobacteria bacterium]|nr:AsmA family protein [Gammaproteobacteria bacterium]